HEVLGIEPDRKALETALARGVSVLSGSAEALPPSVPSGRFDVVVFSHSLEHCREPLKAVRNAARLLAVDGTLVLETPNNASRGLKQAGTAWLWLDVPRHLNFFT